MKFTQEHEEIRRTMKKFIDAEIPHRRKINPPLAAVRHTLCSISRSPALV